MDNESPLDRPLLADVILPLPLADTYTYRLPQRLSGRVSAGQRLIVPFGTKKIYSAIVIRVREDGGIPADEGWKGTLKEAIDLLDDSPVLLPSQLWLWQWIADYYVCSLGEVYKAALPSGMKLESESVVVYNPDYDAEVPLSPTEQQILTRLSRDREQKVMDLQKAVEVKNILPAIKSLLDKGALMMREELKRTYRPKTVHCVRLTEAYFSEARLNQLFPELRRAPKQYELLLRYLDLSKSSSALRLQNRSLLVEVEKAVLLGRKTEAINPIDSIESIATIESIASPQTSPPSFSDASLKALKDRGVLEVYVKEVARSRSADLSPLSAHLSPVLSEAQQRAYDGIVAALQTRDTCLLHGVTSSGKTEIYIRLIQEQLRQGRQVLFMLPEIVLTAQLVDRLRRVFGGRLGVYHSKYPDAERVEVWQRQLSDAPYDIIVGVRSSVFLPFQRLGLVIVDEEHETSFKQQDPAPRYHARNVALVLAKRSGAKAVLGTATPSLETYYNAQTGKYGWVALTERYGAVQLPKIHIVDIKRQRHRKEMRGPFSSDLLQAMREALARREQVILFQNRRGYAPQMECHTCGWTPRCTHCDVTLTYHRGAGRMTCHYCGGSYPLPQRCPNCQGDELYSMGYGTERIEDDIRQIFPEARIARMDLDTTRSRSAYEGIIADFQHGRTDILVGTQMVTKGLDFERVSVVGILNADTMLNMPDFRSYERTFQMMVQVAGRAGRRSAQGHVFLQTKSPDLAVVRQIVANDYAALYREQMEEREAFHYPPFTRLVYIYLKHRDARTVENLSRDMAALLRRTFGSRVLGPDTPPVGRVQMLFIRKLVLKIETTAPMGEARRYLRQVQHHLLSLPQYKSAHVYYDVDPG